MASGGDHTPDYCCVLKSMTCIVDHLKVNEDAKKRLILKFIEEKWIDITSERNEDELVRTALGRIRKDANEYHKFIGMLKDITGMDQIVDGIVEKRKGIVLADTQRY